MNTDKRKFLLGNIKEVKWQGLIEPATTSWASPIVFPKKKNGTYQLCVDVRKLTSQTISDGYVMPDLKGLLKQVSDMKVFSTLDLNLGYW